MVRRELLQMHKKYSSFIFLAFSFLLLIYVILPSPEFPQPLPDALQSTEPADTEDPLRRAYFTNFSRREVMDWYKTQFDNGIYTLQLNYPPENAQTIIRDQTRSSYLEELVHPFRESIFINGFDPLEPKDAIFIGERFWKQKIIVKYIPSSVYLRVVVFVLTLILAIALFKSWKQTIQDIRRLKIRV